MPLVNKTMKQIKTGWCFQAIWKILVKVGIPKRRGENKKYLKSPPRKQQWTMVQLEFWVVHHAISNGKSSTKIMRNWPLYTSQNLGPRPWVLKLYFLVLHLFRPTKLKDLKWYKRPPKLWYQWSRWSRPWKNQQLEAERIPCFFRNGSGVNFPSFRGAMSFHGSKSLS